MSTNSEFDNVFHAIFFVFKGHVDSVWSRKTKLQKKVNTEFEIGLLTSDEP